MSVIGTRRCPETEGRGNALGWGSEKILRHGGNNMNLGGGEAPEGRRRKDIRETSVCKGSAGSEDIMSSGRRVSLRRHRHTVSELLRKELPRWVGQQSFIHLFTQAGPGLFRSWVIQSRCMEHRGGAEHWARPREQREKWNRQNASPHGVFLPMKKAYMIQIIHKAYVQK